MRSCGVSELRGDGAQVLPPQSRLYSRCLGERWNLNSSPYSGMCSREQCNPCKFLWKGFDCEGFSQMSVHLFMLKVCVLFVGDFCFYFSSVLGAVSRLFSFSLSVYHCVMKGTVSSFSSQLLNWLKVCPFLLFLVYCSLVWLGSLKTLFRVVASMLLLAVPHNVFNIFKLIQLK